MSAAQWRARDVARKNDLAQLQSAIVTSQQDKWRWPWMSGASEWDAIDAIWIDQIATLLQTAWMNSIPKDPLWSNVVTWLWSWSIGDWQYWYMVSKRNWTPYAWFILMAKTEVEWWSNWIYCKSGSDEQWKINVWDDLWKLHLCTSLTKDTNATSCTVNQDNGECKYYEDGQLRYILLY
jgi:hypothetical protein